MKKYLFLILIGLSYSADINAQVFRLKSLPASGVITRKEGGTQINIDILNTMPMNMIMSVRYTLKGKNSGAVVATDISNISAATDTIVFNNNDSVRRFNFKPVLDGATEGNDTFIFKLTQAVTMGSIGTPDSVIVVFTDSVVPPITPRPLYNIGVLRGSNNGGGDAGVTDSVGIKCTIRGTLYGTNFRATQGNTGYQMSICDNTGCIGMFSGKTYTIYPNAKEGDSVEISGYIDDFNGLGQIRFQSSGDTIRLLGTGTVKSAVTVSTLDESSESKLVKMDNLYMTGGTWYADSAFDIKMKTIGGSTEYTIRINNKPSTNFNSTALIKTGKKYAITGIGGQYDIASSGPKTFGYQLVPRKAADIVETGNYVGIHSADQEVNINIFPTVIMDKLNVELRTSKKELGSITVYDMNGKIIKNIDIKINAGDNHFALDDLATMANGFHIIQINSESIAYSKQVYIGK